LISNYHVVKDAMKVRLFTSAGLIDAKMVQQDAAIDLAILKANVEGRMENEETFMPLPIAASRMWLWGHGGGGRFSRHRFARFRPVVV
jgi:S1-C subfamily serine protease